ncbi:hypothetical protein ACFL5O_05835 [Myxococcota bacterium]
MASSDARGVSVDGNTGPCASMLRWLVYPPAGSGVCDAARCKAAGGSCGYAGVSCPSACIRRTTDGGKPCTDEAQCQSGCVTDPRILTGEPAQGTCHDLIRVTGCENRVRAGRAAGTVCVD